MNARPGEKAKFAYTAVLGDGERHDFATEAAFDAFIADKQYGESVRRTRDAAGRATEPTSSDVDALKAKTAEIDRQLAALAQRLDLAPRSRKLFARATIDRKPSEPEIFDATLIFKDPSFGGAAAPVYGDVYDLAYLGDWSGRVGSLLSDRSLTLYSQPGFRGLQYWVFVPQGRYATVDDFGWFNGLAASLQYQA